MEDEEYLKLFKKVNADDNSGYQSLNEKPNYNQYLNQKINETPDVSMYRIDENLNDGWGNLDFQIETRVNGVPVQRQQNNSPFQRRQRKMENDINGLGQYLDNENLNEVYRQPVMQPLNDPIVQIIDTPVNENLQDVEVVSVELFNKINEKAFQPIVAKTTAFQYLKS